MGAFLHDVRFAASALRRQPVLTLAVVLTLAIGVGLNGAVFSVVNTYLFKPLAAREPDRIVLLGGTSREIPQPHELSWPDLRDYAALPVFSQATSWITDNGNLGAAGARAQRVYIGEVAANYFDFLGVRPALGRTFAAGEDREAGAHRVVVLTHAFWMRQYAGDRSVIGRVVPVDGRAATIIGVLPASFEPLQSILVMNMYMPLNQVNSDFTGRYENRDETFINVAARLAPGVSVAQARAAAEAKARQIAHDWPATNKDVGIAVVAEKRARPVLFLAGYMPLAGATFLALAGLMLLVACANVAGLLLSRTASRHRELAVRAALGAGRGRIARLLLIESLLLGGAGGAVALGIAAWTADLIGSFRIATDFPVSFAVAPDWRVFAATLAIALAAGAIAGLAPAWRGAQVGVGEALRAGGRAVGDARQRLRSALVVAQVAVAVVVLVSAGMFVRSVAAAGRLPLGFDPDGVLLASLSPGDQGYDRARSHQLADRLLERVRALPGVRSAAIARDLPVGYSNSADRVMPFGRMPDGSDNLVAFTNAVSPGYFGTMRIPLLDGRDFTAADDSSRPRVAIVSAEFARRMWSAASAVGQRFHLAGSDAEITVVGVTGNGVWMSPGNPREPFIYYPLGQSGAGDITLHVRAAGAPAGLIGAVRDVAGSLDQDLPLYDVRTLREHLDGGRAFGFLRIAANLAAVFGGIALVLGAVGLFGLIAVGVEQRRREIGVRIALGASAAGVQRMLVLRGLALVGGGLVVGVPVALVAARGLSGLLLGISPGDPLALAGGIVALALAGTLAAWLPARRVIRIDPMAVLREE